MIAAANLLCPAQRGETLEVEADTLVKIGRYDEARALHAEMHGTHDIRQWNVSGTISSIAEAGTRTFPDSDEARAEMRERFATAAATEAMARRFRGTRSEKEVRLLHARASFEFVEAWRAWHPQGEALYRAGHNARLAGDVAVAQSLFDRAVVELEQTQGHPVRAVAPGWPGRRRAVAWSPLDNQLAVAADDEIVLLDTDAWQERMRLPGAVNDLAFSPDGALLLSDAGIWRVYDGALLKVLDRDEALVFASSREVLTVRTQGPHAELYDDEHPVCSIEGVGDEKELFGSSLDGTILTAELETGDVGFFRAADCSLLHRTHDRRWVRTIAFSPDGELVALGYDMGGVDLLRVRDGARLRTLSDDWRVTKALFGRDGAHLATVSDAHLRLWQAKEGVLEHTLEHQTHDVPLALSPDLTQLVTLSGTAIRLWRVDGDAPSRVSDDRSRRVVSVAFTDDGRALTIHAVGKTERGVRSDPKDDIVARWELFGDGSWRRPSTPTRRGPKPLDDAPSCRRHRAVVSPDGTLAVSLDEFTVHVCRPGQDAPVLSVRPTADLSAARVSTPTGRWDFIGPDVRQAEEQVRCRVGVWSLPFELCRERFYVPHLAERVLRGDPTLFEP